MAVGLGGTAFSAIKTGRDALFFDRAGIDALPEAYLATEIALMIGAYVHLAAMRRFGTRKTRTGLSLSSGMLFILFAPLIGDGQGWAATLLFPIVPTLFAAIFSATWLLAGDLLDGADRPTLRWAYTLIGAAGMVGGMAGSVIAKGLSFLMTPPLLVASGGLLLLLVAVICSGAHRRVPPHDFPAASPATSSSGSADLLSLVKQPYVQILIVISSLASLAGMYIEYRFYAAAYALGKANAGFFANYYFVLCLSSLVLQLFVAPRVQARRGVGFSLLVLPVAVLGGAGLIAGLSTMMSVSLFRIIENGVKTSIHRSSWEQVFLPFEREQRSLLKVWIDGGIARIAGIIGAGLLLITISGTPPEGIYEASSWVPWVLLLIALSWIWVTASLRRRGCEAGEEGEDELKIRLPDT